MTTYCEIRQVPDLDTLHAWAAAAGVPVCQRGITLDGNETSTPPPTGPPRSCASCPTATSPHP
ncbi:VOC family protein [Allosalinactinospora lopnorensis]|uniref:hypothetical protein n=1 Tax=Allosalinactinospora lopnorensis TaxID=1352348 RepID=UPI0012E18019|nr:hypothetical protein [Allosalinactinospora lopnorensis]